MTRRNCGFIIPGIVIISVLIIVSLLYLFADKSQMDMESFSIDLAFSGLMCTMAAIALALVAIGYSIKEADIYIFTDYKDISSSGMLLPIKIRNRGNALGNITHSIIEIEVPADSPIYFKSAKGLNFKLTDNTARKQYRLTSPSEPKDLYPTKKNWHLLGTIAIPNNVKKTKLKFNVQIIGFQGYKKQDFKISV